MPEHSKQLFVQVKERFSEFPNVTVTQGRVPDVLAGVARQEVASIHLNNVDAEIGALEVLFDRMILVAVMVLDEYGRQDYRAHKVAEDPWLEKRGYRALQVRVSSSSESDQN